MDCHKDCHEIFNESFNELSTTDWRYTIPIANHEQHQHNPYIFTLQTRKTSLTCPHWLRTSLTWSFEIVLSDHISKSF